MWPKTLGREAGAGSRLSPARPPGAPSPLQASAHTCPVGPAVAPPPPLGSPRTDPTLGRAGCRPLGISVKRSHHHHPLSMARGWRCRGPSQVGPADEDAGTVGSGARPSLSGQAGPGRPVSQSDSWSGVCVLRCLASPRLRPRLCRPVHTRTGGRAAETQLPLHSWATEFPPPGRRDNPWRGRESPPAGSERAGSTVYNAWSKFSPQPTLQKGKLRQRG